MPYTTIDEALMALGEVVQDVAADMGEDAVEAAYGDLVHTVAELCTPGVAAELLRRQGMEVRA